MIPILLAAALVAQDPDHMCRIVRERDGPNFPWRFVEICTMSPDEEAAVRQQSPPTAFPDYQWNRPRY